MHFDAIDLKQATPIVLRIEKRDAHRIDNGIQLRISKIHMN